MIRGTWLLTLVWLFKINNDDLCCARAIVTMRAHCHKNEGVRQKKKKPLNLVWFSTSNIGQRVQLVLDSGPTGSGKTLVAAVQYNTGIGGSCLLFSVPEVLVMASCISRCKDTIFKGEAAKDYKVEVMVGMSAGEVSTPSE